MEVFQRPVVADQFLSQKIEQLRMGRWTAVLTKVAGCVDNSGAKLELPDSIGDDACREWIAICCNPLSECKRRCCSGDSGDSSRLVNAEMAFMLPVPSGIGFTAIKPVCGTGL